MKTSQLLGHVAREWCGGIIGQDDCLRGAATPAFANASERVAFTMAGANAPRSSESYFFLSF